MTANKRDYINLHHGEYTGKAKGKRRGQCKYHSWVKWKIRIPLCIKSKYTCRSTIFVSNLPYTTTSVDLQTLFSDIAPVRSAFVVTEQGTGLSKGVGYVSFSMKEDAESAFENISKDGINLVGRKLRVQWANNKVC